MTKRAPDRSKDRFEDRSKERSNLHVMERDIQQWHGFRRGSYIGEIRHDASVSPPVFHYLITREGSNEIVVWAQERSAEQARRSLEETLAQFAATDRRQA